jgi:hypothetical protein
MYGDPFAFDVMTTALWIIVFVYIGLGGSVLIYIVIQASGEDDDSNDRFERKRKR